MSSKEKVSFSIMGKVFTQMRLDADEILNRAIKNMIDQGKDDAEIVIKIAISAPDEGDVLTPEFKHTVSSVLKTKIEKKGSGSGETELEWDQSKNRFVVVSEDKGQVSLFEAQQYQEAEAGEGGEREESQDGPLPDLNDEEEDAIVYGTTVEESDSEVSESEEDDSGLEDFSPVPQAMIEDQSAEHEEAQGEEEAEAFING